MSTHSRESVKPTQWVQWGRGAWHVQPAGDSATACGRDVPDDAKTTIYHPAACSRCAKHPELVEAAEATRTALWTEVQAHRDAALERNRAGVFVVVRCRKCGLQHVGGGRGRGVPFCIGAHHEADLETVEVQGPTWVSP